MALAASRRLRSITGGFARYSPSGAPSPTAPLEWLATQSSNKGANDENAALIVNTLWSLVQEGTLAIPRGGYFIRRGRGRINVERTRTWRLYR